MTDREIELLLAGSPEASDEHADLKWFLAALADQRPATPHDVELMATALASVARSSLPDSLRARPRRAARRMVALTASFALLSAMSGIALAADDAAPGDLLYGIDRAFELVGIDDGGIEERIAEFEALIVRGDDEMAYDFLEEVIESSGEGESAEARAHLDVDEDNVSEHQQFIEQNKKEGVGADGQDFGQGVANIARDRGRDLPERANKDKSETPADNDKETGPPGDVEPPETGPPGDVEPPSDPEPPAESRSQSDSDTHQSTKRSETPEPPPDTAGDNDNAKGNFGLGNDGTGKQVTGLPDKAGKKDK